MIGEADSRSVIVAGVDGCPGGWVVVTAELSGDSGRCCGLEAVAVESLGAHIERARAGELAAIAIDMPIGLLDEHPRQAEVEARRVLGPRRSSVFPSPLRVVLDAIDYQDACERSRQECGKAISKQAWNLVPKIRQLDCLVSSADQLRVVEAHPECAFVRLHGDTPLPVAKARAEGRQLRRQLLADADLFETTELDALLADRTPEQRVAPVVDLLDGLALVVTARHVALGSDRRLGGSPPQFDRLGRRADIAW